MVLFRGGGKIFAGNGGELLRPFPFPGAPRLSPARLPSDLHAVMHPQIVEADR
jgi:hypothetical protein